MGLIAPFIEYAEKVGLRSCIPYDPISPALMCHAEDFGLSISDWTFLGDKHGMLADICLAFGLANASEPDDIANLRMYYDGKLSAWQLEYDLKGEDPPPEIRVIAKRYNLTEEGQVVQLTDRAASDLGLAMIDFVAFQVSRPVPVRSII